VNPALPMMVLAASLPGGPQVPPFTDQTTASGLSFTHASAAPDAERYLMTPGVAAADFDRDGWMDLFVPGGLGQNARLFMNNQDGTFTDRAAEWNIDLVDVEGASVTAGDIDGDGDIDLYVGTVGGSNRVLVNFSTILFFDAGTSRGAVLVGGVPFDAFGAAFGDTDLDGDLDLVTAQWTYDLFVDGNRLFAN
jgi:hypothetical protein